MAQKSINSSLNKHAFGMIGVLILQYLLGMVSSLFVEFPENTQPKQLWEYAWQQVPVASHIVVGIVLLLGTLALLIRSFILKDKVWQISAGMSTIATILSIITGSIFITLQSDLYSLIMAIGFIIALLSYGWGLYASKNH